MMSAGGRNRSRMASSCDNLKGENEDKEAARAAPPRKSSSPPSACTTQTAPPFLHSSTAASASSSAPSMSASRHNHMRSSPTSSTLLSSSTGASSSSSASRSNSSSSPAKRMSSLPHPNLLPTRSTQQGRTLQQRTPPSERELGRGLARVAEAANRYRDMKNIICSTVRASVSELTAEERSLILSAFKNMLLPISARMLREKELIEAEEERIAHALLISSSFKRIRNEYRSRIEEELHLLCNEAIVLADALDASCERIENQMFLCQLKADHYRYMAELTPRVAKSPFNEQAKVQYEKGLELSSQVWPAHPLRLSLALNFSVFCHENLGDTKQAVKIAKRYFDGAVTNLSDTARSSRQQRSRILDVLAENNSSGIEEGSL
eukprot:CAMPEP_0177675102 /NCGR_PEP_ID=MMETSP0447-20121125/26984_1 /TAXON_ID=0 /ORGANISM="Stygamoeba regulata, Strain BSH-02190019" /LENGTH=378 /DNA_ID=CAMNT_0019183391 /DNA_START=118 /DNA_END=1255 /DNA_ORIENTATION=-